MRAAVNRPLIGAAVVAIAAMCFAHPGHPPIPTPTIKIARKAQWVPFDLFRGNRLVVPARINGHDTEVLLDTGASMTTLSSTYARSIGLPPGFKVAAKGAGGLTEAELVSGLTLEVGAFRAENDSVGVMDLTPIERSIGRPITAIVGREFFNSSVVSIDWKTRRLRISSPEAFRPRPGASIVSLTKKGPFNTIPVSVAGAAPIAALLDLGNGGTLVLPRTYWRDRPELAALRFAAASTGGVGGLHPARAVLVPQVTLAGSTFSSVPAVLSESGNDQDPTQMANVGIGLLKQFAVDLDLGRDRIYLTPRNDTPAFDRDRAGVRLDLVGDRLRVMFVSPEGPAAAAGLKRDEDIIAVDGHKITTAYYSQSDWTRGPAGKTVVLDLADGSRVKVTLQDYY